MTWQKTCRGVAIRGAVLAVAAFYAAGTGGQTAPEGQESPPTYAIPLNDGRTAVVWWDAISDPARPRWRCEVPAPHGGEAGRATMTLTAPAGDWRAALAEVRTALKGRLADGE